MIYILLRYFELKNSTPETKYLFIKLVHNYGFNQNEIISVTGLVNKFGISRTIVINALRFFVLKGMLEKTAIRNDNGVGRFQCCFRFTLETIKEIECFCSGFSCDSESEPIFARLIDDMLLPDMKSKKRSKRRPLNISNRLLLAVMLSKANKVGVVKNVSLHDLSCQTGMSNGRIISQLNTIKRHGYLSSFFSDMRTSKIFGQQIGEYHLNINILSRNMVDHKLVLGDAEYLFEESILLDTERLFEWATSLSEKLKEQETQKQTPQKYGWLKGAEAISACIEFFQGNEHQSAKKLLQMKVDEYTCALIPSFFSKRSKGKIIINKVKKQISTDLSTTKKKALCSLIIKIGLRNAYRISKVLKTNKIKSHIFVAEQVGSELFIRRTTSGIELHEHKSIELQS